MKLLSIRENSITHLPECIGNMDALHLLKLDGNPIQFPPRHILEAPSTVGNRFSKFSLEESVELAVTSQIKKFLVQRQLNSPPNESTFSKQVIFIPRLPGASTTDNKRRPFLMRIFPHHGEEAIMDSVNKFYRIKPGQIANFLNVKGNHIRVHYDTIEDRANIYFHIFASPAMERMPARKTSSIRQPSFTERGARGPINEPEHRPPSVDLSYTNISVAPSYPTSSRFDGASTWDTSNYATTAVSSWPDPRRSDGRDSAAEGKQRFSSAELNAGSSARRSYAETLFSVNSAVGDHHLIYIESFLEHLSSDLTSSNGSSALNMSSEALEKTLKDFALILHEESYNPFQWDASITLYKTRQ